MKRVQVYFRFTDLDAEPTLDSAYSVQSQRTAARAENPSAVGMITLWGDCEGEPIERYEGVVACE